MKLIFITLVGVNLIVLIWGLFLREELVSNSVKSKPPVIESKVKTITAEPASLVGGAQASGSEASNRLCELVGDFASEEEAGNFVERLRSIDIESSIDRVELDAGSSYWVHLPVEPSSAAAFSKLSVLQALDIESYVIGQGDLKNAVSLGVFTQEQLALARKAELMRQGFEPIITAKPRTEIEIWVSVQPEFAEKISEFTWETLLDGMTSQERRQNFCLPVAS